MQRIRAATDIVNNVTGCLLQIILGFLLIWFPVELFILCSGTKDTCSPLEKFYLTIGVFCGQAMQLFSRSWIAKKIPDLLMPVDPHVGDVWVGTTLVTGMCVITGHADRFTYKNYALIGTVTLEAANVLFHAFRSVPATSDEQQDDAQDLVQDNLAQVNAVHQALRDLFMANEYDNHHCPCRPTYRRRAQ